VVRLSDSDVSEMDVDEGSSATAAAAAAAVDYDKRGSAAAGGRSSRSAAGSVPLRSTSCSPTRIKQRTSRSV